ncbi:MAG: pyridoxal phosphate-dependent aminotransferase [Lachnospiraceae bacterium]|nr:pyridoxal phosphate-dependent aminotransferase [Lachnospiraceae bacterium]
MIAVKYKEMLGAKSVIRELSEYASARGREIGYENVFDYSLGNPSVPAPEKFKEAVMRLLTECDPMTVHGYSPSLGIPSVKEKIAESLNKRFGMNYTASHIFMTAGAAGAIAHAVRCVTVPGDEVLAFAPFFPEYHPYIDLSGARLRVVPADTDGFQINFDRLEEMLTGKVAALLVNTPNNPSGVVYTRETLERLAELLRRKTRELGHRIYLISDEPYREILFRGAEAVYVSSLYEHTISCYSYSKSLSVPGERIGYLAVNPACEEAETIVSMCGQISRGIGHNCPSSLMQLAVAEVVCETADLSVYETNRDLLYEALTSLGFSCVKPGGTFYIFPKALEEDAVRFCRRAMAYDLILVPGDSFGCPGYFRMAYCMGTEKVERSIPVLRRFVEREYGKRQGGV